MSPTRSEPDNGLRLALMLADDDLANIEDYFDARMDTIDGTDSRPRPNTEMALHQAVRRIRQLHARIIEGKPTTPLTYTTGG